MRLAASSRCASDRMRRFVRQVHGSLLPRPVGDRIGRRRKLFGVCAYNAAVGLPVEVSLVASKFPVGCRYIFLSIWRCAVHGPGHSASSTRRLRARPATVALDATG
jgi:hypothetical protein